MTVNVGPETVSVIGAGTMGHGIAQVFAAGGCHVRVSDVSLPRAEAGVAAIEANLHALTEQNMLLDDARDRALDRLSAAADIAECVVGADLIVEAVPEDIDLKRAVWEEVAGSSPANAILTSNTSSFDIAELAAAARKPASFLGMHWYNPPYLVPCVEIVRTGDVAGESVARVLEWLRALGKSPVVTANAAGFVGNRLQFAMIAEAFRCLEDGVASAEDIDMIVKTSFGFRLGDYGPFEIADMAGIDVYRSIMDYLAIHLGERFAPPANLTGLAEAGKIGVKTGEGVYQWPQKTARRVRADRDRKLRTRLGRDAQP